MIGRMPARLHSATAAWDSTLGGSIIAIRPRKIRSYSSSIESSSSSDTTLYAKARTRSPDLENSWFISSIFFLSSGVIGRTSFPIWMLTIRSRSTSTAPLTTMVGTPSIVCFVAISLRSLSKGFSLSLGYFALTSSGLSPSFVAILRSAVSVGSPISTPSVFEESLQRMLLMRSLLWDGSLRSMSSALMRRPST